MSAVRWGLPALCALVVAVPAHAQSHVAGEVIDASSLRPIAGASVTIDEGALGTLTDGQGRFRIGNVAEGDVLIRVAMLGYRTATQVVPAGGPSVRIALEPSAIALDAIVVTGTTDATQRRALGNSVATIDASRVVSQQQIANVSQLLQARAGGVSVVQPSGMAGGGSRIMIRGPGSFSSAGDPLIYVDGVRVNSANNIGPLGPQAGGAGTPRALSRLDDINPADIERIEIIRGPAAATLYGSEASAGVIQIITKRGASGQTRFNVNLSQGASWFNDAENRLPTTWGVNPTSGQVESLSLSRLEQEAGSPLFRTGHLQGVGLNLRGGSDFTQYYAGIDFNRDEGVIPSNNHESMRGRLNLSLAPRSNVHTDVSLGFNVGETTLFNANYLGSIIYSSPSLLDSPNRGFLIAPAPAISEIFHYTQDINRYQANVTLRHAATSWLNHRLTTGVDFSNQRGEFFRPVTPQQYQGLFSPTFNRGTKVVDRTTATFTTADYAANAVWRASHSVGATTSVGAQYNRRFQRVEGVTGSEFPAPGVSTISAASVISGSENFLEESSVGVFFQQQVSWRDRLFVTGAIRADDHSAFGADFELVTYPKLSASWVVSDESFWLSDWMNAFRLRAAYGESGQQPATFAAIRTYMPISGENDQPAGSPQSPGNPDLGPERGREIEVGFDGALFADRLGLEFTYYRQKTSDVIVQRAAAPSAGFIGAEFINAGEVLNRGFEALVRATPYRGADLAWDLTLNVSNNQNRVLSIGVPGEFISVGWIPNRHQVGFPANSYFVRKIVSAELDGNGNPQNVLCDGGTGRDGLEPGGTPVPCSQAPALYHGKPYYDWVTSVGSTVTLFNRLNLSALFDVRAGGQMFESVDFWNCSALLNHEIVFFPERYSAEKVAECRMGVGFTGTTRIQDNGFTKLRELSLNYSLPNAWAGRLGATAASVTLAGRNLYTWTSFDGLDPEVFTPVNYMGGAHTELTLPLPRTLVTTVNLTF
jgi:outer membrane receptor protein involved in Fe transport